MNSSRDDSKLFQTSNGTVGFAWLLMFNSSLSVNQQRATFATELKEEVCTLLSTTLEMLLNEFKHAESEGMKLFEVQQRSAGDRRSRSSSGGGRALGDKKMNFDERTSAISSFLATIHSVNFRRIEATNKAISSFEALAKKMNIADDERFVQLRNAISAVDIEEDEASLCSKIIAESSTVPQSAPSINLSSSSSEPLAVPSSPSSDGSSTSTSPERPRLKRTASTLGKIFHSLRGDGSNISGSPDGARLNRKTLSKKEITVAQAPGVVGVSIEQFMANQKELYPDLDVPLWCVLFKDSLTRFNAQSSEGLFRISSGQHAMKMYKEMLAAPLTFKSSTSEGSHHYFRLVRSVTTVPVLASLFKFLLRDSPNPVIPGNFYDKFINKDFITSLNATNFKELVIDVMQPVCHRNVFIFVIGYIRSLAQYASVTKMGPDNLALIFAPCILRCPIDNPAALLQYYELEQRFVKTAMSCMPEDLYRSLNTVVPCFPDGTPYNGKGCELVKDDPLCAKYHIVLHDVDSSDDDDDDDESAKSKPTPSSSPAPASASGQSTPVKVSPSPTPSTTPSSSSESHPIAVTPSKSPSSEEKKVDESYTMKVSKLKKRAEREVSCIIEAFDHIRSTLSNGSATLSLVTKLRGKAENTMLSLQFFAEKTLNCTDADLQHLQDEPSFHAFENLCLPEAMEKEPSLFETAGELSETLSNIHVVLTFIRNTLDSTSSVSMASKIAEALKLAKTTFVIPVTSILEEHAAEVAKAKEQKDSPSTSSPLSTGSTTPTTPTKPSSPSSPKPKAEKKEKSSSSLSKSRLSKKVDKKEVSVRHKSQRMSLTTPDVVYTARLKSFESRLHDALVGCDDLIKTVENGTTKRDVLVSFIRQVRPFITLERHLHQFIQDQKITIEDTPLPTGDADSILTKIQLVKYHLSQSVAYIEGIVNYVGPLPKPVPADLLSSLDTLVATAEALF